MKVQHFRVIHGLAILSLVIVTAMSLAGALQFPTGTLLERIIQILVGATLWGMLIWKMCRRPRQWGLGVGIFLALMIVFQTYLWWLGSRDPRPHKTNLDLSVWGFIPYEIPLLVGAICCVLLRWYPRVPNAKPT